jgi:hypothetical protein
MNGLLPSVKRIYTDPQFLLQSNIRHFANFWELAPA